MSDEALRDARFIQSLEPIPDWLPISEVVTAERWGSGWDIDGDAYWAVEGYQSSLDAWGQKPVSATHVAIYHK
jgi:hypothetical protein